MFFEHIERVITSDSISMEIAEAAISSILSQTETHLSSTSMPPQLLTEIYHKFLADNHVTNHTPLPILQTKLQALEMITPPTANPSSSIIEKMPKLNKNLNPHYYCIAICKYHCYY